MVGARRSVMWHVLPNGTTNFRRLAEPADGLPTAPGVVTSSWERAPGELAFVMDHLIEDSQHQAAYAKSERTLLEAAGIE